MEDSLDSFAQIPRSEFLFTLQGSKFIRHYRWESLSKKGNLPYISNYIFFPMNGTITSNSTTLYENWSHRQTPSSTNNTSNHPRPKPRRSSRATATRQSSGRARPNPCRPCTADAAQCSRNGRKDRAPEMGLFSLPVLSWSVRGGPLRPLGQAVREESIIFDSCY